MKKILLFATIIGLAGLSSCKGGEEPNTPPAVFDVTQPAEVAAEGDEVEFRIVTEQEPNWTITKDAEDDWFSLSEEEGTGDATITITVEENTVEAPREADITVTRTSDGLEKTVKIKQLAAVAPFLEAYGESKTIAHGGGTINIEVTSNVEWTVALKEPTDWITDFTPKSGEGNDIIVVTASANPGELQSRSATFIVSSEEDGVDPVEVTVRQDGKPIPISGEYAAVGTPHGLIAERGPESFDISTPSLYDLYGVGGFGGFKDRCYFQMSPSLVIDTNLNYLNADDLTCRFTFRAFYLDDNDTIVILEGADAIVQVKWISEGKILDFTQEPINGHEILLAWFRILHNPNSDDPMPGPEEWVLHTDGYTNVKATQTRAY